MTAGILGNSRQTFHPIAAVQISHALDVSNFRFVDVAAQHRLAIAARRFGGDRVFKIVNIADRVFHLVFEKLRQRPVLQPHFRAPQIEPAIGFEREHIQLVAELGQPLHILHHAVEQIAVQYPNASPVRRGVNHLVRHLNSTDGQVRRVFEKIAHKHVVVAGDEDNARTFARLAQQFLNHIVVRLRPVPALFELPAINDVSDQINALGFVVREKIQQSMRLTVLRAQMNVGQPQGAVTLDFIDLVNLVDLIDFGHRRFKLVHLHDFTPVCADATMLQAVYDRLIKASRERSNSNPIHTIICPKNHNQKKHTLINKFHKNDTILL